ncbi:MAG: ribonuclease P protein component [Betaproteobacteria bacterium]|nr:ribonuclease P protein component [Betaproteobacteria bacterium]MDE1981402.1 ribonuclease P protein component [Betaproteobacteria bacterium]MDE2132679.1 ribonuclease P protein component [Betaproteobacteria bacterium]MDE2211883.1 ribonuclease P protein component [Betaproteobacteria bacterium]MDE2624080.1 ribonuclease P protein component [Betaproteobacteria bacterium]
MVFGKISDSHDFEAVLRARCAASGSHLRLMARPNGLAQARLGLIVGRKVCPSAVGRNYMKRVSRELFRRHSALLAGLDVVVQHKKPFASGLFDLISTEFETLALNIQKCRDSFKSSSASTSSA